MAKARKKSPGDDRARQMAAVMNEFAARHNSVRENWLDDVAAGAQQIIDHASEMSKADVADARELVFRCRALREYASVGNTLDVGYEGLQIGLIIARVNDRDAVAIARQHTGEYVIVKDQLIPVGPLEHRILDFINGKTEASMIDFVRAAWDEMYTHEDRGKYRTAISKLAKSLSDYDVPLSISIRGTQLLISQP